MNKGLKRGFIGLMIVLVITIIAAVSLVNSQRGTRFLLQKVLPAHVLTIASVDGSLLHHVVLQGVHSEVLGLSAQSVRLQWQPQALLVWQLKCLDVSVTQLKIQLKPDTGSQSAQPKLSALHWPWYWPRLALQQVRVDQLSIELADHSLIQLQQAQTAVELGPWGVHWTSQLLGLQQDHAAPWNVAWQVQGPWQHYQLAAQWQAVNDRQQAWSIHGTGEPAQISIDQFQGKGWPNHAQLQLQLTWWPQLQIDAHLASTDLDISQWWPEWPSHLQVDMRLNVLLNPDSWRVMHWQGQLNQLQGQLRQRPVTGQGRVEGSARQWRVTRLHLQSGQAILVADGDLGTQQTRFSWRVNILDMADIWPKASGSLLSTGELQGAQRQLNLSAQAKIQQLQVADYAVKQAGLDFAYRTSQPELFRLQLTGEDWRWHDQRVSHLAITSQGQYSKQRIDWSIQSSLWRSQGRLVGGFDENIGWRGVLQDWQVAPSTQAPWRLRASTPLVLTKNLISVPQALCLQQGRQWLCGQGEWQKDGAWRLKVSTSALNLTMASFLLSQDKGWQLSGQAQAQLEANGLGFRLDHSRVRLDVDGLRLGVPQAKEILPLNIGRVHLTADTSPGSANASLSLQGPLGHWLAKARSVNWQDSLIDAPASVIDATLTGQLSDWTAVRPLLPSMLHNLMGRLDAKAMYRGTLDGAHHQSSVDLRLSQASVTLQDYNIRIAPLTLSVSGDPGASLKVMGHLPSGAGFIDVVGSVSQLWTEPQVALALQGQNFLATNLSTYQITASPDLRFTYQATQMHLDGDLLIPKATLRFVDYQQTVVKLTSDAVYVDDGSSPLNFYSHLQLRLGDQVTLQYGGLKGRLLGQVALLEQPSRLTQGRGEIRLVDGVYQAYGQSFTIRKGVVQFNGGEVTNPLMDVEAVRMLKDVVPVDGNGAIVQSSQIVGVDNDLTVGIRLHGPLNTSQIKLFSQPPGLSQADILSYLLIGRPTSEATGSNAQLLMSAASLLSSGAGGGGAVTQLQQQLKNTLGLEVDVGATSQYSKDTQTVNQNTSVILGKALSPRLFLNYSIGITQPVNVLRLTYRISPKWSAQTESSSLGNGGDLFYTINSY